MPTHNRIYIAPSHTKKIFRNMRRVGKGFSGRETTLFQTMVVQDQAEMGEDKAVNEEMDDSMERAATTATSLDAEHDRGNINKTQSKATPNKAGSQGTTSGGGHRRVKKLERRNKSRTHRLKRMYKVGSSRRVKSSKDEGLGEEDASKQVRINAIDANEDITLVNNQDDADMFDFNDLDGDEVIVDNVEVVKTAEETRSMVEEVTALIENAKLVSAAEETIIAAATTVSTASTITVSAATTTTTCTITDFEITLAQALAKLKSAKPKANKVVKQEPEQGTTTTTPTTVISVPKPPQDKCKGIMIEEHVVEQVKPIKRLEQIRLDEELPFKLQAEEKEKEKERLDREKAHQTEEANTAWDDVQAKIKADYQLAQRLQAQEQEELTDEEKARLLYNS
ncbi:hypothetical protein Tco_0770527 [Tanacetum coccineum]|uniref:Uncharacterized protein n=1 Tax=Tanacetum coccineum TaxID=301880 RepID=A0ABQ4ZDS0_9ASTR